MPLLALSYKSSCPCEFSSLFYLALETEETFIAKAYWLNMAAKDNSAITQDDIQEDEETTTPVAVLVSMSDAIQKLINRLDDFVSRHNPDHIPPPKRLAISVEP